MAQFDTVANIIADVGTELGLGTLVAAYPATDDLTAQLQALLKTTGRGLALRFPWLQLKKDYNFTATATTTFNLPSDFLSYVDGSGWNRTKRQPLSVVSPTSWEGMKATGVVTSLPVMFRPSVAATAVGLSVLELLTTATANDVIAFEYYSRNWVATPGSPDTFSDAPAATTDVVRFDVQLITRALKLAWLRAKGMDSSAAQGDFEDAVEDVRRHNIQTAPTLSLNGPSGGNERFLDVRNAPDTGYGS
jgi:hypothetical protein